jgi:hypothetical protein
MIHRSRRLRPTPALAVLIIVLAVAFAGVAWAGIPGSDGVINSCYNASSNPSGQLRVIDAATGAKCAKNEKALTFNQIGPKGDQGVQGIQGIPGVAGVQGIQGAPGKDGTDGTDGTNGTNGTSDVHQASSGSFAGPLSVSVPAGKYLVVGDARLGVSDTDFQDAVCSLQGTVVAIERTNGETNIPIMGTVDLASPGTITLDCGGFSIFSISKRMFVTRVTSIING